MKPCAQTVTTITGILFLSLVTVQYSLMWIGLIQLSYSFDTKLVYESNPYRVNVTDEYGLVNQKNVPFDKYLRLELKWANDHDLTNVDFHMAPNLDNVYQSVDRLRDGMDRVSEINGVMHTIVVLHILIFMTSIPVFVVLKVGIGQYLNKDAGTKHVFTFTIIFWIIYNFIQPAVELVMEQYNVPKFSPSSWIQARWCLNANGTPYICPTRNGFISSMNVFTHVLEHEIPNIEMAMKTSSAVSGDSHLYLIFGMFIILLSFTVLCGVFYISCEILREMHCPRPKKQGRSTDKSVHEPFLQDDIITEGEVSDMSTPVPSCPYEEPPNA